MRRLAALALSFSILAFILGTGAQAQIVYLPEDPTIDIMDTSVLSVFHFFFQHLVNLDAAADAAEAADNTLDASAWRTLDQVAAGLTEQEGTILKGVAYGCIQALQDHDTGVQARPIPGGDEPPERMQIVSAAIDQLRTQLGEDVYQTLASYVQETFGPDVEAVINIPIGPMPPTPPELPSSSEVATTTPIPPIFSIGVAGHVTKLPGPLVFAECVTNLADDAVRQSYISGVTFCNLQGSLQGSPIPPVNVPCDSFGICVGTFTSGGPGMTRWTEGAHGVRMVPGACGFLDPLHFCRSTPPPLFQPSGSVFNLGGDPACWPGLPECLLAFTRSRFITFMDINPWDVTLVANQRQAFAPNLVFVAWGLSGPGFLQGNVYTAPPVVTNSQTAIVTACDAFELTDCTSATIHLEPLSIEVTPASIEALAEAQIPFTATISPSGQQVTWSLTGSAPLGFITTPLGNTTTTTYTAPNNNDLPVAPPHEITIKACIKPDPAAPEPTCDTATVTVPKIDFRIMGSKTTLAANETLQLTAQVLGSSIPRKVKWTPPTQGTLTPVNPDQTLDDTLHVIYQAPLFPTGSGIDIKACFQDSPSFCAIYHINFVQGPAVTSITSDTGIWNAGAMTSFTINGTGFGSDPTVRFSSLPATVTFKSDIKIQGLVRIPVAMGGKTIQPILRVNQPNGDFEELFLSHIPVGLANLGVAPGTADLRAGESKDFSATCFAPAIPCTSQEIPTWTASLGTVNPTTGINVAYRAPASVTSNTTDTVRACWDVGYCATATVNLLPAAGPVVTVTPPTVVLGPAGTQDFNAEVTNSPNSNVTWSLQPPPPQGGNITPDGLYTAPSPFAGALTVTVIATSVADPTKQGTATVTLIPAPLTLTSTPSPAAVRHGTLITWTATATGGVPGTYEYALFRKKVGTPDWIPARTSPSWQTSNELKWTPSSTETGDWEIEIWVKDAATPATANTHGYAASHNPGPVKVAAPLSITCTPSPASAPYGLPITWTVTPSGGVPGTIQYAFFRRRSGTSDWIPAPSSPAWQGNNVLTWTPLLGDLGAWDTFIWARDSLTPPNQNNYGYATSCNPGPVQVVVPISLTSTPSPAVVQHGTTVTWTATATGGVQASLQYALFRRKVGTADWVPARTSPQWQTNNILSWVTVPANVGDWEIEIWAKDGTTPPNANGYGYAAIHNPGPVKVVAPLSITCTPSPASASPGVPINWTVTPNGGVPGTIQYAFFRRRSGTTAWIPDPSSPAWQANNLLSWTPNATDVGAWDTYIWAKDSLTSPNQNGHGYAASCNPGPVQVVAALSVITTPSPAAAYHGSPITWTATATGGTGTGRQYALFRKKTTDPSWTPDVTSPVWQTDNTLSWTPVAGDVGTWQIIIWAKDSSTPPTMNTYGYAAYYNAGPVQVVAPLTVSGTGSPAKYYRGNPISWTATAGGGTGTGRQYALFRKLAGATSWTPDVTSPAWQTDSTMSWTPGAGDAGTWEIIIWARDSATPPTMNTYGFAAYYNAGPVQVVAPPTLTITPSPPSSPPGQPIAWTVTVHGGITPATYQYALFRRRAGTSTWTPSPSSPSWQASNVLSWNPGPGDVGTWEIYVWVKDNHTPATMNTYGYAAGSGAGSVQIVGPPTLTCPASPPSANPGTTITWPVPASGGVPGTIQYALHRRRIGTASWIPSMASPAWQTSNVLTWTPGSGDVGAWEFQILIRDANTPPNSYAASCSPGSVQVLAPLTVSGTGSPASANHGTVISWTATASGGTGTGRQYALFRKPAGALNWIPDVNSADWQSSPTMTWIPAAAETGTWEIIIWAKDSATPPTMNTYGFAAYYNAGPVEVTAPLYQSHAPIGWVDGHDRQHIWGWACDPDYPTESNRVDIWSTSWQYLGSADAHFGSSSPINSACGGGWAHYFDFHHNGAIPPGTHFMVWSIDLPYSTPGNDNRPLGGNGSIGGGTEFVMP
jgi:hypothetical protein